MKTRQSILGLLAFAASMVVADVAHADCWGDNRVTFHHSECLHGWWDNNSWPKKSTFGAQVQNDCHLWGTVVAKVDLASCSDKTWHLNNTSRRRGSEACRVNGIHCCKDVGDLCNKKDLITVDGCTGQFDNSPASDTCYLSGGEITTFNTIMGLPAQSVTYSTSNLTCNFWAKCEYTADDASTQEKATSIQDVHWLDADGLVNCNGELKEDSC